jgi:hypothetical protein
MTEDILLLPPVPSIVPPISPDQLCYSILEADIVILVKTITPLTREELGNDLAAGSLLLVLG